MLHKEPAKRLELIEFVTWDYNIMEEEDFEACYKAVEEEFQ